MQQLTDAIWEDYQSNRRMDSIQWENFPDRNTVKSILANLHRMVFFRGTEIQLEQSVAQIWADLKSQLRKVCPKEQADELCREFLGRLPAVRALVETDLLAAFEGDPAATGYDEIVLAYPGLYAITVYRLAHELYRLIEFVPQQWLKELLQYYINLW